MGIFLSALIGSIIGSFCGVVIDRLPAGESIVFGRSHCGTCQAQLRSWELIPILSAVSARFRCRRCKARFPIWYTGLEIFYAVIFAMTFIGWIEPSVALCLLMTATLSIFDWQSHSFPFIVWLFFAALIFLTGNFQLWMLIFLALSALTEIFHWPIGSGDLLWLFTAALTVNFLQLIEIVQIASLTGILYYFLAKKKGELAFIPFLGLGYLAVLLAQKIL